MGISSDGLIGSPIKKDPVIRFIISVLKLFIEIFLIRAAKGKVRTNSIVKMEINVLKSKYLEILLNKEDENRNTDLFFSREYSLNTLTMESARNILIKILNSTYDANLITGNIRKKDPGTLIHISIASILGHSPYLANKFYIK